MPDAAIYARQRDESIEDQVRVCREAAERNGDTVVRVYEDRAISGTSTERRSGFARMVADAPKGFFSSVYVYKTDRFARNRYDSAVYKAKLKKCGVKVVSATEHIQDGPDGILLEALLEGMAEYYSANLAENVRRGLRGNAMKCRHNGIAVYGYDHAPDGTYSVNEGEAKVVRKVFEDYLDGLSISEIRDDISPWARTRRGKAFGVNQLSRMLRNDKYTGLYHYDDIVVDGGMPVIIDRHRFNLVQRRLERRQRKGRNVETYALSGKLFDMDGNPYQSHCGYSHTGAKHCYYRCPATGRTVRKDEIEDLVLKAFERAVNVDGVAARIARMIYDEQEAAIADDVAAMDAIRGRMAANRREQAAAIDLAVKLGANDQVADKIRALQAELEELTAELKSLEMGTPVLEREEIEYWIRRVMAKGKAGRSVYSLVSKVCIDAESGAPVHLQFVFDEKEEPAADAAGSDNTQMVDRQGFEPWTLGLRVPCSSQLS